MVTTAADRVGDTVNRQKPVLPGQVFRDNDSRVTHGIRYVQVLAVDSNSVWARRVTKIGDEWIGDESYRTTRIRIKVFHSKAQTGFTLVDSPVPVRKMTIEIEGADDLIAQRLLHAIDREAREFDGHFTHLQVSADGSSMLALRGKRTVDDLTG